MSQWGRYRLTHLVVIQKMMLNSAFFVSNNGVEVYIFCTLEYVVLNIRVVLLKLRNELLSLKSLRGGRSVLMAGGAGFCEMTGAL